VKRPKFTKGQFVGMHGTFGFGQIHKRKWFTDHFSYELFPVTEHNCSGWYDEGDLRPLTKRERGPVVQRRK
jgi:hypothetical protein